MKNVIIDKYLVPFDFTDATEDAFLYALTLAKKGGGEVMLIHFIEDVTDKVSATAKIKEVVNNLQTNHDKEDITYRVFEGSIYNDLDSAAKTFEASAIVMGTHGRSGLQKVFGSHALKVVSESHIPFILTQERQTEIDVTNIVMPFSFERKSVQVTQFAASMAAKFDAKIHLVGYKDDDKGLENDMKINQALVQKHLSEHGIKYEVVTVDNNETYEDAVMSYARLVSADLLAAAYFESGLKTLFGSFVDRLIENEDRIPVLTVNGPDVMVHSAALEYTPI